MNLVFRFFSLIVSRFICRQPLDLRDVSRLQMRVWPVDLDFVGHMNNGRYLSIMDLGRIDLMLRANYFWPLFREGVYPVVVSEAIRFRRSLRPFQKFHLDTQLVGIDEKHFFIKQVFFVGDQVMAEGVVKARFILKKQGPLMSRDVFAVLKKPPIRIPKSALGEKLENLDQLLAPHTLKSVQSP